MNYLQSLSFILFLAGRLLVSPQRVQSDGSEASNSSSSASAINDHPDHPPSSHHHHHSNSSSGREPHSKQSFGQQQQQQQQRCHDHRSSAEAVLRQRAANRQDLAHQHHHHHQRLLDHEDIQRLDEWTSHHQPGANQRQSSLAETDCDVSTTKQRWSSSSHAIRLDVNNRCIGSRISPTLSPEVADDVDQQDEGTDVVLDMPPSPPSTVSSL